MQHLDTVYVNISKSDLESVKEMSCGACEKKGTSHALFPQLWEICTIAWTGRQHCLNMPKTLPKGLQHALQSACCIAQNHIKKGCTVCRGNSIVHSSPCTVHNTHIHFTPTRFLSFWCMFRPKARSTAEKYIKGRQLCQTSAPVANKLLRRTVRIFILHCKKRLSIFPSQPGCHWPGII